MSASVGEYLTHNPPRCLSGLKPDLVSLAGDEVVWQLRCGCGSEAGSVLGYPLGDLKPGFEGSGLMVSPFRFLCGGCGREAEFLNTAVHGEGSEFATREGSDDGCAAYRGEGEPTVAACPSCRGRWLRGVVTVTYHDDRIADWEEDESFPLADFFNWFRLDCECRGCGHAWELTVLDTKP